MDDTLNYFAYGSNLCYQRIAERIGECEIHGVARLSGYRLVFHKVSPDGSGKCNAFHTTDPSDELLGVIYRVTPAQQGMLDEIEGVGFGYDAKTCCVETGGEALPSVLYVAQTEYVDHTAEPYEWYKDFVVHGARQHGLPESYIGMIERVRAMQDPDTARHSQNAAILLRADSQR